MLLLFLIELVSETRKQMNSKASVLKTSGLSSDHCMSVCMYVCWPCVCLFFWLSDLVCSSCNCSREQSIYIVMCHPKLCTFTAVKLDDIETAASVLESAAHLMQKTVLDTYFLFFKLIDLPSLADSGDSKLSR
jgi:hypothetical protein